MSPCLLKIKIKGTIERAVGLRSVDQSLPALRAATRHPPPGARTDPFYLLYAINHFLFFFTS